MILYTQKGESIL